MLFSQDDINSIEKIIKLYRELKPLIILAEESDPEKKTLMSVFDELRHSYDHFLRVLYKRAMDPNGNEIEHYVRENLDKTLSHLYRSGWDTLDWLNVSYYDLITDIVKKYHSEIINTAIPEYYASIRSEIESIKNDIVEYRKSKDIGNIDNENFQNYIKKIYRMKEIYELIVKKEISLIELKKKKRNEILFDIRTIIAIIGVIGTIIGVLLYLLG